MTEDESAFVDAMGHHMVVRGMPRMAARLWAWLIICEQPEQSASDLAEALHASRGAISAAAGYLVAVGLVRRSRRRGERREYFSAPPGSIQRLLTGLGAILTQGREIADEGLATLVNRSAASRRRLEEVRDVYAYYEREWPDVVGR